MTPSTLPAPPSDRLAAAGIAQEYPFGPHFLEVDGGRMHYVDEGSRTAAPILMVHGNPSWSFLFRRLVRALSKDFRCVAPDHVGCGLSDKPQDWRYDLAGHVENLERLVLALDLKGITLVVHDWGGPIGLGVARRHPERIARVVITNTAAFPGRAPLRILACRAPWIGPFLVRRLNAFAGTATTLAVRKPLSPAARAGFALPYRTAADRVAIARFVQDIPLSPRDPSWEELAATERSLERWRAVPAAILWGERDFVFTPRFREEWQRRLPHAQVLALPDAGHWLFEDEPERIETFLRAFVVAR